MQSGPAPPMQPRIESPGCWRSRAAAGFLLLAAAAGGYVHKTDFSGIYVYEWEPGVIAMQIKLSTSPTLIDGGSQSDSVRAAMNLWNSYLAVVQFNSEVVAPTSSFVHGNGVSEIVITASLNGQSFPSNALAVTISGGEFDNITESDIAFNSAYSWNSYRGTLRAGVEDMRRVAIHELGHVLGLEHPDEASPPQSVDAIMNSRESHRDIMASDDISGAQALYGSPGFQPVNNNFANATAVTTFGGSASVKGSTIAATGEAGEPLHGAGNGGPSRSVWWRWTATSGGTVNVTTLGSNFDTTLGIYTGTSVGALTLIAANDDVDPGIVRTSTVTFTAVAGTTYSIAVDGWDGYYGQVTLNVTLDSGGSPAPVITSQPSSRTSTPGGSASFSVSAAGDPTGYQWSFNGTPIEGATSSTLTLASIDAGDAGIYRVTVTNGGGSITSTPAILTVLPNPVAGQTVVNGRDVAFSATGAGNIQWQVSTDNGTTWTDLANGATYSGVNTSTLLITGATSSLNGNQYRYTSTDNGGTATSNAATLTVAAIFFPFATGIAIDASGNLYVTDSSTNTVQKINSASQVTLVAGASGTSGSANGTGAAATFNQPGGVASAGDATLTIADTANGMIRRVTSGGVVTTFAGSATVRGNVDGVGTAATFSSPAGIALDPSGRLVVADSMNNTIRAITPGGAVSTLAGSASESGTADGTGGAARFNHPVGVAVDSAGNAYIADSTNNTIRKVTSSGVVTTFAGLAGIAGIQDGDGPGALFNGPQGVALDSAGNVYVADTGSSTIRKISPGGSVITLAGLPGVAGLKDSVRDDAWFNKPQALVVDGAGTVYVADTGNAAIRRVSADGTVTTLALTEGTSTGGGTSGGGNSGGGSTGGTGGGSIPTSGGGGGGGGGAPSVWFLPALFVVTAIRLARRRARDLPG